MEREPAPDPIMGSLTGLVPTVLLALYKDVSDWTANFSKLEGTLEIAKQSENDATEDFEARQAVWEENISCLIYDVDSTLRKRLETGAGTPVAVANALREYSTDLLFTAPETDRVQLFNICNDQVSLNDWHAFLEWLDKPRQEGEACGLAWLRGQIDIAVQYLDPSPTGPDTQSIVPPSLSTNVDPTHLTSETGHQGYVNPAEFFGTAEEEETPRERAARKAKKNERRRRRSRDERKDQDDLSWLSMDEIHRLTLSELSTMGGAGQSTASQVVDERAPKRESTVTINPATSSLLMTAQSTIREKSLAKLRGLKEGDYVTIYYHPGSPRVVAIGIDSIPRNLKALFKITALGAVKQQARRGLMKRAPVLRLSRFDDEAHAQNMTDMVNDLCALAT